MDFFCQVMFPLYIVIHGKEKKKKSHHQNLKRSYLMKKIFKQLMSQCVFIELWSMLSGTILYWEQRH